MRSVSRLTNSKEESEPIDRQKLEEIDQAIEGASDTVDEIDDAE
jgi:hypothetical protein